jgi:cytoskeletal protein CcmA (bactofilin family)
MQPDEPKDLAPQESLESSLEENQAGQPPTPPNKAPDNQPQKDHTVTNRLSSRLSAKWSVYLPIFIILIIGVIVAIFLLYKQENKSQNLSQQNLTPAQLNSLANSNNVVGNSSSLLTVQSNSIFNGEVLIRGQLQVAGPLKLSQLQVNNNLAIAGNAAIQGTLTVQNDLSVNGNGSFAGTLSAPQINTNVLQLNGSLTLNHHIITSGSIPSSATSAATGSGGTTSINGSDTAGTVTINTGAGPSAGCYINARFASAFNTTPHMLLTPVGSNAATLSYYVNRSSTGFSLCSNNAPAPGQTYVFDYFVID